MALELASQVAAGDAAPPLSEAKLTALRRHSDAEPGVVIVDHEDTVFACAVVAVASRPSEWGVEVVIPVGHRNIETLGALIDATAALVSPRGASVLRLWLYTEDLLDGALALGFEPERTLLLMRRPLPGDDVETPPRDFAVRGFRVGEDEDRWLRVNNAAFATHPENSNWDRGRLEERLAMSWFDPAGLRMAWDGDTLLGFCWTKVHPEGEGEIYIIAAAPEQQGRGMGRALVIEGMRFLAEAGLRSVFLFCEADNTAAVALYRKLGFTVDRSHRSLLKRLGQPNR